MMQFAVLASGRGTNLQAIIEAVKKGTIKARIAFVLSDNPKAFALQRAQKASLKSVYINPKSYRSRASFDREVLKHLWQEKVDFVILAGFMRILSPVLTKAYRDKILNIHPALLPSFKGSHAIKDAFDYGVHLTGVTVHLVDDQVDHGPIVLQEAVEIKPQDTLKSLEAKIHTVEHRLYPKAIQLLIGKRLRIKGRKVLIKGRV